MSLICQTKYPLFMIHGCGFRDYPYKNYWGRIPDILKEYGATIFYGQQDAWGTIEENARMLRRNIFRVLQETGAEKVNLIAHSKGGLEARYLISSLQMAPQVASLTTLCTPHSGSLTADKVMQTCNFLVKLSSHFVNAHFQHKGDLHPNFYSSFAELSTSALQKFNKQNPDSPLVYYQSYGALIYHSSCDWHITLPHLIISRLEGSSDGLVPIQSAQWTNYKGTLKGCDTKGISHGDIIDLNKRDFVMRKSNGERCELTQFYIDLVADLKRRGF